MGGDERPLVAESKKAGNAEGIIGRPVKRGEATQRSHLSFGQRRRLAPVQVETSSVNELPRGVEERHPVEAQVGERLREQVLVRESRCRPLDEPDRFVPSGPVVGDRLKHDEFGCQRVARPIDVLSHFRALDVQERALQLR